MWCSYQTTCKSHSSREQHSLVSPSARGHRNKTKQDFRLTGFAKVSSRVSAGTNDSCTPPFWLVYGQSCNKYVVM